MKDYPLAGLLAVRALRENNAKIALAGAEKALAQAMEENRRRKQTLETYRAWLATETDRRYASIMDTVLSLAELDDFKADIAALEAKEQEYRVDLELGLQEEENLRQTLARQKDLLARARKDMMKMEASRAAWVREMERERERLEDLEREDGASHGRDAWH